MPITSSKISAILRPHGNNPRNSEGDFLRLKDGRILFAFSYYRGESWGDHCRCDIRALVSRDEGETFVSDTENGEPRLLVNAADFGEKNVMSVTLLRMQNGDAGLVCILKHADGTDECLLFRSSDECETFAPPVSILPGIWKGYYVLNNCRVERLSTGRLIAPVAQHDVAVGDGKMDGRAKVVFYTSDDDGVTWSRRFGQIAVPDPRTKTGLQEPGVIELPNGVLYCYMRTDLGFQYESYSIDGELWTPVCPSAFTSPPSPMKIARNPYTGEYFAVYNPIPNYNGRTNPNGAVWGRTPLALVRSADGVHYDFAHMEYIEDDLTRGFCYPALFFADANTLLLAYCSGGGGEEAGCLQRLTVRKVTVG